MYNRFNFYKHTFAIFNKVATPDNFEKAQYISKHGSQYFFTSDGVYRLSNHWGRVGNCRWKLENIDFKQQINYWGFCRWEKFYNNDESLPFYFIEKNNDHTFSYNHKNNTTNTDLIFRSASDTAKILKKINELQQDRSWAKHLNYADYDELLNFFISQLIQTKKTFIKIKQEYINTFL